LNVRCRAQTTRFHTAGYRGNAGRSITRLATPKHVGKQRNAGIGIARIVCNTRRFEASDFAVRIK
jgi:hypothetical protein